MFQSRYPQNSLSLVRIIQHALNWELKLVTQHEVGGEAGLPSGLSAETPWKAGAAHALYMCFGGWHFVGCDNSVGLVNNLLLLHPAENCQRDDVQYACRQLTFIPDGDIILTADPASPGK